MNAYISYIVDDLAARLALVPLVQEARGLDAGPRYIERFMSSNDKPSAAITRVIVEEEERHVQLGVKWFEFMTSRQNKYSNSQEYFQALVKERVPYGLVPPFNVLARANASLPASWYEPLVIPR